MEPRAPLPRLVSRAWLPWHPAWLPLRGNRVRGSLTLRATTFFDHGATNNLVEVGPGFRNRGLLVLVVGHGNHLSIGRDVSWGGVITLYGDGLSVEIGDRCDAKGVHVVAHGADVRIGADALLAQGIQIRSSDVHKLHDRATGERLNPPAPVMLGRHVGVAGDAFIGKGAVVADGCVVGARSLVTGEFTESDCVLAGSPARVIRHGVVWER
ncbi:MAG TPA: hypothetical protein VGN96_18795 [Roseococcus sp.]|jgi:acetyltransferase-like isoleucine patch superfamily enzyme|nr:hypothetical protein [Roseococcus sp.]